MIISILLIISAFITVLIAIYSEEITSFLKKAEDSSKVSNGIPTDLEILVCDALDNNNTWKCSYYCVEGLWQRLDFCRKEKKCNIYLKVRKSILSNKVKITLGTIFNEKENVNVISSPSISNKFDAYILKSLTRDCNV